MKSWSKGIFLLVILLAFSVSLTWAGEKNLTGSSITAVTTAYQSGTTTDLEFILSRVSNDSEWIDYFEMDFPPGVTVNSASDIVHYDGLDYNNETGDGALISWGLDGGSDYAYPSAELFTVNVTIDPSFTGILDIFWFISGDNWGSDPHFAEGTIELPMMPQGVTAPTDLVTVGWQDPTAGTHVPMHTDMIYLDFNLMQDVWEVGSNSGVFAGHGVNDDGDAETWFDVGDNSAFNRLAVRYTTNEDLLFIELSAAIVNGFPGYISVYSDNNGQPNTKVLPAGAGEGYLIEGYPQNFGPTRYVWTSADTYDNGYPMLPADDYWVVFSWKPGPAEDVDGNPLLDDQGLPFELEDIPRVGGDTRQMGDPNFDEDLSRSFWYNNALGQWLEWEDHNFMLRLDTAPLNFEYFEIYRTNTYDYGICSNPINFEIINEIVQDGLTYGNEVHTSHYEDVDLAIFDTFLPCDYDCNGDGRADYTYRVNAIFANGDAMSVETVMDSPQDIEYGVFDADLSPIELNLVVSTGNVTYPGFGFPGDNYVEYFDVQNPAGSSDDLFLYDPIEDDNVDVVDVIRPVDWTLSAGEQAQYTVDINLDAGYDYNSSADYELVETVDLANSYDLCTAIEKEIRINVIDAETDYIAANFQNIEICDLPGVNVTQVPLTLINPGDAPMRYDLALTTSPQVRIATGDESGYIAAQGSEVVYIEFVDYEDEASPTNPGGYTFPAASTLEVIDLTFTPNNDATHDYTFTISSFISPYVTLSLTPQNFTAFSDGLGGGDFPGPNNVFQFSIDIDNCATVDNFQIELTATPELWQFVDPDSGVYLDGGRLTEGIDGQLDFTVLGNSLLIEVTGVGTGHLNLGDGDGAVIMVEGVTSAALNNQDCGMLQFNQDIHIGTYFSDYNANLVSVYMPDVAFCLEPKNLVITLTNQHVYGGTTGWWFGSRMNGLDFTVEVDEPGMTVDRVEFDVDVTSIWGNNFQLTPSSIILPELDGATAAGVSGPSTVYFDGAWVDGTIYNGTLYFDVAWDYPEAPGTGFVEGVAQLLDHPVTLSNDKCKVGADFESATLVNTTIDLTETRGDILPTVPTPHDELNVSDVLEFLNNHMGDAYDYETAGYAAYAADYNSDNVLSINDAMHMILFIVRARVLPLFDWSSTRANLLSSNTAEVGLEVVDGQVQVRLTNDLPVGAISVELSSNATLTTGEKTARLEGMLTGHRVMADGVIVSAITMAGNGLAAGSDAIFSLPVQSVNDELVTIENVTVLDINGNEMVVTLSSDAVTVKGVPAKFAVAQNYPNPFNPATTISYQLPAAGKVNVTVFNAAGQVVRTLVDTDQDAGYYDVRWDGRNDLGEGVASGVYFYTVSTPKNSETMKMMLLK